MGAERSIFIFGASGHGKVVVDLIRKQGRYDVAFAIDDAAAAKGQCILTCLCIGGREELLAKRAEVERGIVTIGNNERRMQVAQWLTQHGIALVSAAHPSTVITDSVTIGHGTVVMAACVINPDTAIGGNVIINTGARIDHDCVIGDHVHIGPSATLCGGVVVERGALIGAGSVLIPGVRIGEWAVIGAGSTVLADVPAGAKMAGSPCRPIEKS